MLAYEIGVFLVIILIGVIAYYIGRSAGQEMGYAQGYKDANNAFADRLITGRPVKVPPLRYPAPESARNTNIPRVINTPGRWH